MICTSNAYHEQVTMDLLNTKLGTRILPTWKLSFDALTVLLLSKTCVPQQ